MDLMKIKVTLSNPLQNLPTVSVGISYSAL
jgi:hypothetical protein